MIFKPSGRIVKSPSGGKVVALLSDRLKRRGYDFHWEDDVKAVVIDWLIEFCECAPGGIGQQVMLAEDFGLMVDRMAIEIELGRIVP